MACPSDAATGPLVGIRVVEIASQGPGPFAAMLLSDMGADVVRIDRPDAQPGSNIDLTSRGRTTILLDLKDQADREHAIRLIERADILIEGFRPGVMERLGLGPEAIADCNPRLVYGRMTGWGQEGPLAKAAGHDINYIAITGALDAIGPAGGPPVPPLNLVGDYGGGALYLALGTLAALIEARQSGQGQVVDAAICDGATSLMTNAMAHRLRGTNSGVRGNNLLDGGAPYYGVYETADGGYVSIGSIEPKFFRELCERLNLPPTLYGSQHDRTRWPELRAAIAAMFLTRSRDEWTEMLEGTDMCFAPVIPLAEATAHPHLAARGCFVEVNGLVQPAPAPRFARTPSAVQGPAPNAATRPEDVLSRWT